MSESFKRWYPEEIKARNGAVLTTRYIAETHYDALAAELTDCKSDLKATEKQGDAAHEACVQYEARIAQLEADIQELTCGDPRLASLKREGPHCPTCSCGLAPETTAKPTPCECSGLAEAHCDQWHREMQRHDIPAGCKVRARPSFKAKIGAKDG